ncbi:MAG: penicillin acylase family protein, partial [Rubrivivax sp.]
DWALPYRQQRIEQLLQSRPLHSLADLQAMQADTRSRAAPLIFWAWQRQLAIGIFSDEVGTALWQKSLASRTFQDALEGVLQRDDTAWCDDRGTPAIETCAMQAGAALTRALAEMQPQFGADVASWQWQRAHTMRAEHRPFSRVPALARLFELRAPVGGDTHTLNVSRVGLRPDPVTGELYLDEHGPSLRAVYDVADLLRSQVIHSSGQSGIVFSPRYRSFLPLWASQRYVPLWRAGLPDEVLLLHPAPSAPQSR